MSRCPKANGHRRHELSIPHVGAIDIGLDGDGRNADTRINRRQMLDRPATKADADQVRSAPGDSEMLPTDALENLVAVASMLGKNLVALIPQRPTLANDAVGDDQFIIEPEAFLLGHRAAGEIPPGRPQQRDSASKTDQDVSHNIILSE